jgi:FtsH-binding integral membrane protein
MALMHSDKALLLSQSKPLSFLIGWLVSLCMVGLILSLSKQNKKILSHLQFAQRGVHKPMELALIIFIFFVLPFLDGMKVLL